MGTGKKERISRARQGKTGTGMDNVKVKGENFYRSAKKIKTLNMFKEGKAIRNSEGKILKAASYQSKDVPNARIEPNRRWFSNTRVISQDTLASFRDAMAEQANDPFQVLLKSNKLPMSLIRDEKEAKNGLKQHQAKMTVEGAPFADVFGPKAQRKRVKLSVSTIEDLADDSSKSLDTYKERREQVRLLSGNAGGGEDMADGRPEETEPTTAPRESVWGAGTSKRIWGELFRTIDSSDVVLHVIDARDPEGTRCRAVETYLKREAPHKHLIFVLNKTDLVPTSVAANWVRVLQKEHPVAAFKASMKNPFGKGSLIALLRQFSSLLSSRKQIQVGIIGYPNVGKSSIINTLRNKRVCNVAPIPGETKVWQYVTLMKRIYLIDSPGIVPANQQDGPEELLLRGVVRVERVNNPEQYIPAVLKRVKHHHMARTYDIPSWNSHLHLLELLARKSGRLLKGGEPDVDGVARQILNDFMRGKIPWFSPPPTPQGDDGKVVEGREGRLGEMPMKRKRDAPDSAMDTHADPKVHMPTDKSKGVEDEEEFEGFSSGREEASHPAGVRGSETEEDDADDIISLGLSSEEEDDSEDYPDEEEPGDDDEMSDHEGNRSAEPADL